MTTAGTAWGSSSNTRARRASRNGVKPKPFRWDYTRFGKANALPAAPDETIEMTIVKHNAALERLQSVDPQRRSLFDGDHEADVHGA